MVGTGAEQRLAAILVADVVGYTRLVEHDTAATVEAWTVARDKVIRPRIEAGDGRLVKLTGDGFLAMFSSVQAAVECAIALQRDLRDQPLNFRMGVALGDVLDDGLDVHGEGVNIAARIETLCDPGGVCISGDVYRLVRNRVAATFIDRGEHEVKNISVPVPVYAIPPDLGSEAARTNFRGPGDRPHRYSPLLVGLGVAVAVVASVAGWLSMENQTSEIEQAPARVEGATDAVATAAKPQAKSGGPVDDSALVPGDTFKECDICPEMIVIPAGKFEMGWADGYGDEKPTLRVNVAQPLAVGRFEITFAEWDACVDGGGCGAYGADDNGWGRGHRPVINVSWHDAGSYVSWLRTRTKMPYRLLSEAEWEYAARAGSSTLYPWGVTIDAGKANYGLFRAARTVAVGSYDANGFGLFDMIGNVWEWVADCYQPKAYTQHDDYPDPVGGDAECRRVLRGGSWSVDMSDGINLMRVSIRESSRSTGRFNHYGFRVAREIQ